MDKTAQFVIIRGRLSHLGSNTDVPPQLRLGKCLLV